MLLAFSPSAWAAELALAPNSRLWLEGDSTLHPFSCEATRLQLRLALETGEASDAVHALEAEAPARGTLKIPVAGLKSKHSGLDKNLRKALRADEYPEIVFALSGYRLERSTGPHERMLIAAGDLSIANVTKRVSVRSALHSKAGSLVLEGDYPLLMTDYGIRPPKALLGTVKTDDRVVIKFRMELEPAKGEAR